MIFDAVGNKNNPAILFFHAMGVTGQSSSATVKYLKEDFYCIMPTSTVYCKGQKYKSKTDEIRQIEEFLRRKGVKRIALIVASSIGADLAMSFIVQTEIPVEHVFFDGGQFAQINAFLRCIMTPFLFLAIKSLYWTKGKTLKKILWCDDEAIKPYFIKAGEGLSFGNLRRQMRDSLINKPFPKLPEEFQRHCFWEFGSVEDHFKYRENVKDAYKYGHFPVFEGFNHMQFQIRDPEGFAKTAVSIINENKMPDLPFLRK